MGLLVFLKNYFIGIIILVIAFLISDKGVMDNTVSLILIISVAGWVITSTVIEIIKMNKL